MDGNQEMQEITADLESMKKVGISNLIFLKGGIGVPRGLFYFMSEERQELYVHAVEKRKNWR